MLHRALNAKNYTVDGTVYFKNPRSIVIYAEPISDFVNWIWLDGCNK